MRYLYTFIWVCRMPTLCSVLPSKTIKLKIIHNRKLLTFK